jgi:hypothetical protein
MLPVPRQAAPIRQRLGPRLCWTIPAAEAGSIAALVIYDGDAFVRDRVYFSLDALEAVATGDASGEGLRTRLETQGKEQFRALVHLRQVNTSRVNRVTGGATL